MKILSVDDSPQNRYLVESILRSSGHEVTSVSNGQEALDALAPGRFDLIVSDILMPVLDGFELCREVKRDAGLSAIPFVFYSATYTDARDRALALGLGADAFLIKPSEPDVFLETLQRVVAQAGTAARPTPAIRSDEEFVEHHRGRVVQKLEAKLDQLSQANSALLESERSVKILNEELRRANERLKEREAAIEISQRVGRTGSWVVDIAARTISGSEQFFQILGTPGPAIPLETLVGRVIHPADAPRVQAAYHQCLETSHMGEIEHRVIAGDDVVRHVCSIGELTFDRNGAPSKIIGCLQDLTERKRGEEARARLEAELNHSQKMEAIGTLAGGIAHDFNNVLTAIIGYSELLRLDVAGRSFQSAQESISMILEASHRAKDLVRQILAFSRKQPQERTLLEPAPVIREAMKLVRATLPSTIRIDLLMDDAPVKVLADKGQLEQVLLNLCTNASQAMGDQPGALTVGLGRSREPVGASAGKVEFVVLSVRDTGCGMTQEIAARVFEPFFTTKPVGHGTGLGLSVVHGIVQSHDGMIRVASEPGNGSEFKVFLPVVEGQASEAAPEPPEPGRGAGELIMFIDDESPVIHIGRRALEHLGYRVEAFNDPEQALASFNAGPGRYAAVITDLTMPHMNGIDLSRQIKAKRPDLPVILTTGFSGSLDQAQAREMGFADLLPKPFPLAALGESLRRAIRKP